MTSHREINTQTQYKAMFSFKKFWNLNRKTNDFIFWLFSISWRSDTSEILERQKFVFLGEGDHNINFYNNWLFIGDIYIVSNKWKYYQRFPARWHWYSWRWTLRICKNNRIFRKSRFLFSLSEIITKFNNLMRMYS